MCAWGALATSAAASSTPAQPLPLSQDWSNAGLITTNDDWSGVPGIEGRRGDDLTTAIDTDPRTILADGAGTPIDVIANQTNVSQLVGGVAEFALANPTVALQASAAADAPHLTISLDTTGARLVRFSYLLRDIDTSADNSVAPVVLQYRVGNSGPYANVPGGFVADASAGPSATKQTPVSVILPPDAADEPFVELRVLTINATDNDEWIGVDDINAIPVNRPAYVVNQGGASATPFDTVSRVEGSAFAVGTAPIDIAITPEGDTAYVSTQNAAGDGRLTPVDTQTNSAGSPIDIGDQGAGVAISPDGRTAYVAQPAAGSVTPVDTQTNTAGPEIPVDAEAVDVAVTPDGATVYVTGGETGEVVPIDTATNAAGTAISVPDANKIAITPDGSTAYASTAGTSTGSLVPIDTATNTAGPAIALPGPAGGVAISPKGDTAYVLTAAGVTPVDIATGTAGTAIPAGTLPTDIAITPDGKTAFVSDPSSGNVFAVDLTTNTPGVSIGSHSGPAGIAIVPDQSPTASLTSTPGPGPFDFTFDAEASTDPDGTVTHYSWGFGGSDNERTTAAAVTHTYARAGAYHPRVNVSDNEGCGRRFVFTGQTAYCTGNPGAHAEESVKLRPSVVIDSAPHDPTTERTAEFIFSSDDPTASLRCRLVRVDADPPPNLIPCSSPQDYSGLRPGLYRFKVRAVSAPGLGSSIARWTWRITRN